MVNCWLNWGFVLHYSLYWFIVGQGRGAATLEAKLVHQLAGLARELLFQMLLDIRKVYNSLDRNQCLEVLSGYGVGTNLTCPLKSP